MERRILNVLLIGLTLIVSYMVASLWSESRPRIATYSIYEDNNSKDKRKHPIIKIVNESKEVAYSSCSAFIINDSTALTAGHCIDTTKMDIKHSLTKYLKVSGELEELYLKNMTYLETNCTHRDTQCMYQIRTYEEALAKLLKERKKIEDSKPSSFKVIGIDGEDTGIKAIAYSKNKRRDFGYLEGDFKGFRKLPLKSSWHVKKGDILRTCGFFGGFLPPECVDFEAIGNHSFSYKGHGVMVPGVSGGPVIDHMGYAVGIATGVAANFVIMTPTIGVIDHLTKKQSEELKQEKK